MPRLTWCYCTATATTRNTERGVSDNDPYDEEPCKCESHALSAVEGSYARPEGEERQGGR